MTGRFHFAGLTVRRYQTSQPLSSFAQNTGGNITILVAIIAPMILFFAGATIDFGRVSSQKAMLQAAVDSASLAAAKELGLTDSNRDNTTAVVQAVVDNYLKANTLGGIPSPYEATSQVIDQTGSPLQVEVTLKQTVPSVFGPQLGLGETDVVVNAVATVVGKPNICLLALEPTTNGAIDLNHKAKVVGQNCSIFSNSTHKIGVKSKNDARLTASSICSAGGVQGGGTNFEPAPMIDCPQFSDPLVDRPEPVAGACTASGLAINNQSVTLTPGTYCGGISIKGTSYVAFKAGVYILKDGPLDVDEAAQIDGTNVGFYFSGQAATFSFNTNTVINLAAPKDGPMAGLLFFGSRSQSGASYKILSDHAHQLLGTIYLPQGKITIDANQPIADRSAYTAIVANKVVAYSGPTVMLNTNYDATDVPVPDGIRGAGMPAVLSR